MARMIADWPSVQRIGPRPLWHSAVAEEFATLIGLLESTLPRQRVGSGEQTQFIIQNPSGVQDACDLAISISARLPASRRESWRWRQIFLRTIIDRELIGNDGRVNAMCNEAAMELRDLYWAANAASPVAPITLDSLAHPVPW